MPWEPVFNTNNVDEMIENIEENLTFLMNRYAPVRSFPKRSINSVRPWFNTTVKRAILERDIALRQFKRTRNDHDLTNFRVLRNHANTVIRDAKVSYFRPKLETHIGSKNLWRNLRNLGLVSSDRSLPAFTANDYGQHLSSNNLQHPDVPSVDLCANTPLPQFSSSFSFSCVTPGDVESAVFAVGSNAVGLDGVHIKFVKILLPVILPILTHVMNSIFTTSTFPSRWKVSKVLPVHKKSRSYDVGDFRPISILPSLSKVFEILAKRQITAFLESNNMLNVFQSGFRSGCSTASALLKINEDIRKDLDAGKVTILVLLDFSKAFDTIDHLRLCNKLRNNFNFSTSSVSLINSYITGRTQCISIGDVLSDYFEVTTGVPQGSVMGPLLFSMFINDLPCVIVNSNYHLFADDVQIYKSCLPSDISACINQINDDLTSILSWSIGNRLHINPSKSQAIIITGPSLRVSGAPNLRVGNDIITYVEKIRNLGIVMNSKLGWSDHASYISSQIYARLRSLWLHWSITPQKTRCSLVKSLLIPLFTYADVVFSSSLNGESKQILNRAFKACIRYAFGIGRYDSISDFVPRILGCDLFRFFDHRSCNFIFRLITFKKPLYLIDFIAHSRSLRTLNLNIPHARSTIMRNSFFVRAPGLWNSLPPDIKHCSTFSTFRGKSLAWFCE